jgi:hypothetical protein
VSGKHVAILLQLLGSYLFVSILLQLVLPPQCVHRVQRWSPTVAPRASIGNMLHARAA